MIHWQASHIGLDGKLTHPIKLILAPFYLKSVVSKSWAAGWFLLHIVKPGSQRTAFVFPSDVNNGLYGNEWWCSHFHFQEWDRKDQRKTHSQTLRVNVPQALRGRGERSLLLMHHELGKCPTRCRDGNNYNSTSDVAEISPVLLRVGIRGWASQWPTAPPLNLSEVLLCQGPLSLLPIGLWTVSVSGLNNSGNMRIISVKTAGYPLTKITTMYGTANSIL